MILLIFSPRERRCQRVSPPTLIDDTYAADYFYAADAACLATRCLPPPSADTLLHAALRYADTLRLSWPPLLFGAYATILRSLYA